jgi:hypothetical protein
LSLALGDGERRRGDNGVRIISDLNCCGNRRRLFRRSFCRFRRHSWSLYALGLKRSLEAARYWGFNARRRAFDVFAHCPQFVER